MMPVQLRWILTSPVGERTIRTLVIADVQVPDGASGVRFPSALELAGLELTITDLASGTAILATESMLPTHGSYNSLTGVLLVTLAAADNVIVNPILGAGKSEWHRVFVHMPDLLWVEIDVRVQNQASVGA